MQTGYLQYEPDPVFLFFLFTSAVRILVIPEFNTAFQLNKFAKLKEKLTKINDITRKRRAVAKVTVVSVLRINSVLGDQISSSFNT